jgi:hypothetical protein
MPTESTALRRTLRTTEAAKYLGLSASLLRKMRTRGDEDPRSRGPAFIKVSPSLVLYEIRELDGWLESHLIGGGAPTGDTNGARLHGRPR